LTFLSNYFVNLTNVITLLSKSQFKSNVSNQETNVTSTYRFSTRLCALHATPPLEQGKLNGFLREKKYRNRMGESPIYESKFLTQEIFLWRVWSRLLLHIFRLLKDY